MGFLLNPRRSSNRSLSNPEGFASLFLAVTTYGFFSWEIDGYFGGDTYVFFNGGASILRDTLIDFGGETSTGLEGHC